MLNCRLLNEENQFAIPREKYILKNQFFFSLIWKSRFTWKWEFKRDLLDIMSGRSPNYKIESDISNWKDILSLFTLLLN